MLYYALDLTLKYKDLGDQNHLFLFEDEKTRDRFYEDLRDLEDIGGGTYFNTLNEILTSMRKIKVADYVNVEPGMKGNNLCIDGYEFEDEGIGLELWAE